MGYEQHGLTREEDNVLGGIGTQEGQPDSSTADDFSDPEMALRGAQSLEQKGLLYFDEDNETMRLTPKGLRLWHIRAREEEDPFTSEDQD